MSCSGHRRRSSASGVAGQVEGRDRHPCSSGHPQAGHDIPGLRARSAGGARPQAETPGNVSPILSR